jgi:eukaryotic translation initiation factor 2C
MYVGVDLCHSPLGLNDQRSIVAVVASADDIPNRYFKEIYIQNRFSSDRNESVENVVKMKEIMKSLVSQYEQHRGYPPKAIVIYRDGIADSVFDTVFKKELIAIREACVELCPVYQPCLTYIVVNEGHHTRFFPTNLKGNIVAGTVIDSHDVTNPTTYNFFLKSHHWPLVK